MTTVATAASPRSKLQSTVFPRDQICECQKTPNKMEPKHLNTSQPQKCSTKIDIPHQKLAHLARGQKENLSRSFLRFQVNKWARCKLPEVLLHLPALILAPLVQKTQDALLKGLRTLILRKLQRKRGKVNNRRDALKHCLHIQVFIMCLQDLDFLFVLNNQLWVQWRGLKLYYHNVYMMVHPDHLCTDQFRTGRRINFSETSHCENASFLKTGQTFEIGIWTHTAVTDGGKTNQKVVRLPMTTTPQYPQQGSPDTTVRAGVQMLHKKNICVNA